MSRQRESGPLTQPTGTSRWPAFAVLTTAQFMIILDTSIVGIALPSIQRGLGFSQSGLAWVVNAYLIAFGGLLLLSGRLGDLIGRKRVFVAGLLVFTAASLLCGTAVSQGMLVAARFVQGIGGAMAAAVVLGISMTIFPEPGEQAKALGVVGFVTAAGGVAGGLLIDAASWHWIFFVNVPVGIAAAALAVRLIPADRGAGLGAGADAVGAVLATAGLMLFAYTIIKVPGYGWGSAHTLGLSARLVTRLGQRSVLLAGLSLITTGLALFARAPVHGHYVTDVLPVMLLAGGGAGLAMPALMGFAMSSATPDDAGLVSGLFATGAQIGGALGLAALAALATARTNALLAGGQATAPALTSGYRLAFGVSAAIAGSGIVLAATVLRPTRHRDVSASAS